MKSLYANYQMIFNALSFRERVLICVAAVALIFVLWRFGLWNNLQREREVVGQNYTQLKLEIADAKQALQMAQEKLEELSRQQSNIASLLRQQSKSDKAIGQYQSKIVQSHKMAAVLKDLLFAHHSLVLQEMKNLPVEPIGKAGTKYLLYKHPIVIRFKGGFFATMCYLKDLEKLRERFFWGGLNYKVEKYPAAEVTLQVYTLSDSKELINV